MNIYKYRKFLYSEFNIIEERENHKSLFFRYVKSNEEFLIKSLKNNNFFNFEIIKVLSNIKHPNILRIFSYYKDDEFNYIITPFLNDYITLRQLLVREITTIKCNELIKLIKYLANAIDTLHLNNIVHFDLVSINILIKKDFSDLKIIDFDLCKFKNFQLNLLSIDKIAFFEIIMRLILKFNLYTKDYLILFRDDIKFNFFDNNLSCDDIVNQLDIQCNLTLKNNNINSFTQS